MTTDASKPIDTVLRNKKNTQDFWIKVLNGGDYSLIDKMLAPDYQYQGHPSSHSGTETWLKGLKAADPNAFFLIESIVGANDTTSIRWTLFGTFQAKQGMITGENFLTWNSDGQCSSNWQSMGSPDFAITWSE